MQEPGNEEDLEQDMFEQQQDQDEDDDEELEELLLDEMDDDEDMVEMVLAAAALGAVNEQNAIDREENVPKWGGSRPGKSPNKKRDFKGAHDTLVKQYFSGTDSVYDEVDFERRFRMPRVLFNRIYDKLVNKEPFVQKYDFISKEPTITPLVRMVAALRQLGYGEASDRQDEYLQISGTVAREALKAFVKLVVQEFGAEYLNRCPTHADKMRALEKMAARGFPGCFSSWDCKHFNWKNCPVRLAGQAQGHSKGGEKTLILEAICDPDLYLWYIFFGEPGSLNDINILGKSSIVGAIMSQDFDTRTDPYEINGHERNWLYFLADGIYPKWSIFCKTNQRPTEPKEKFFAAKQEAVRKDIERCFGVIVQRFGILKKPLLLWYLKDIRELLNCCVILHNMIVEVRRPNNTFTTRQLNINDGVVDEEPAVNLFGYGDGENEDDDNLAGALAMRVAGMSENMKDAHLHSKLQTDIMEHNWILRHEE
jgi:hypothetical protein